MRILITGGSGFIGTNLCKALSKKGNSIISIDVKEPKIQISDVLFYKLDLTDENKLNDFLRINYPFDVIYHLAAKTDLSGKSLDEYKVNWKPLETIINSESTKSALLIFTSSMLVHGRNCISTLGDINSSSTFYGKSKAIAEKILLNSKKTTKFHVVRPTSVWGPFFGEPYSNFFKVVRENKFILCSNRRMAVKSMSYIENSVNQLIELSRILPSKNRSDNIYYLMDKNPINIREWALEISKLENIKLHNLPYFIFYSLAILGDILNYFSINFPIQSYRLDNLFSDRIVKNAKVIDLKEEINLNDGTKRTLNWIKSNA